MLCSDKIRTRLSKRFGWAEQYHFALHHPGLTTPPKYLGFPFSRKNGVSGLTTFPLFMILLIFFMSILITCLFSCARFTVSFGSFSRLKRYKRSAFLASLRVCAN